MEYTLQYNVMYRRLVLMWSSTGEHIGSSLLDKSILEGPLLERLKGGECS